MLGVRDVRESPMPRVVLEHLTREVPDYTICLLHLLVVTLSLCRGEYGTGEGGRGKRGRKRSAARPELNEQPADDCFSGARNAELAVRASV